TGWVLENHLFILFWTGAVTTGELMTVSSTMVETGTAITGDFMITSWSAVSMSIASLTASTVRSIIIVSSRRAHLLSRRLPKKSLRERLLPCARDVS
ncbi:hypothetical protein BXZ70DRAFT_948116, partial [Cristinia sonorae]